MNLVRTAVHRPVATTMITMIVIVVGGFSLYKLPIDLLPDITLPTLTIRNEYGNASPEEMERLVTELMEETVSLVSGVDEMTSESAEGASNIRVKFAWGTDLDAAANDVRDRIDRITDELPEDLPRPILSKYDISNSPVVILGVSSAADPVEMTTMVEDQVLHRFERIPGVAAVDIWGEYDREIRVELDIEKVMALNLPLDQILESIRQSNVNLPAGEIDRGRYEVTVRTPGEYRSLEELKSTVVAVRDRGPVRLGDIATIVDTYEEKTRLVRVEGELSVRLGVRKQSDANTAEVAAAVIEEVDRINADMPQLNVIVVRDQGRYIERAIANVGRSVMYGGGLAIIVLLIFLGSFSQHDRDCCGDSDFDHRDIRAHFLWRIYAESHVTWWIGAGGRDDGG